LPGIPHSPVETISDLAGIFFFPANGSISIFGVVPLFLVMAIIAGILLGGKKIRLSIEEKKFIFLCLLISLAIFLAYEGILHIMNTDFGVVPDMRYLSPAYLPLIVIGLILLKKVDILPENPADSLKRLFLVCSTGLIISILFLSMVSRVASTTLFYDKFFSLYALVLVPLAVGTILYRGFTRHKTMLCEYLIFLLCSLPFFWQVNLMSILRYLSAASGYIFWIPVVRVIWEMIMKFVFL
jgi:hypothetical protein